MNDARGDARRLDGRDHELHQPVIDEDAMADLHLARQRRKGRGDDLRVPHHRFRGDDERLPVLQLHDALDVADTDLRPLNVADDRHVAAEVRGRLPHELDDARPLARRAVGEIEAEDIDAAGEQAVDALLGGAGGAEGGDDFGSAQGVNPEERSDEGSTKPPR